MDSNLEKSCVLLDTLVYYDQLELEEGKSLNKIIENSKSNPKWQEMMKGSPAFMTGSKPEDVLNEIQSDPYLANLKVVNFTVGEDVLNETQNEPAYVNSEDNSSTVGKVDTKGNAKTKLGISDGGPTAICLENAETKELYFVYRGTNRLEWIDNAEGFLQTSSRMQEHAVAFFNKTMEAGGYEENGYTINVTGHSKGGNKAQYVTIVSEHKVDNCINFDGQGFSESFCNEYAKQIEEKSHKITTIAADRDIVSPLGIDIAGEHVFYNSHEKSLQDSKRVALNVASKIPFVRAAMAHSPGAIFHSENGCITLNECVNERRKMEQQLGKLTEYVMKNGSKEEQETGFTAVMSIISNIHNTSHEQQCRVIYENTPAYGVYGIGKGLLQLGKLAVEQKLDEAGKFLKNTGKAFVGKIEKNPISKVVKAKVDDFKLGASKQNGCEKKGIAAAKKVLNSEKTLDQIIKEKTQSKTKDASEEKTTEMKRNTSRNSAGDER